jgi:NADPH-dependent curcumin reductase CurA
MSNNTTRVIILKSYANGTAITESNFSIESRELPEISDGEVFLQTLELSPEPYMRGRMTGEANYYVPQLPLNQIISGFGVARVLGSKHPAFEPGQVVYGVVEWADRWIWKAGKDPFQTGVVGGLGLVPISPYAQPYARALDVVGVTGMTAYFAITQVARPGPRETMLISSAAGSVGSIAGQIAKIHGTRVIGLAGSDEKCRVLTEKLGFDGALNYKSAALEQELKELIPGGPDIYVDNVGGALSQMIMYQMHWPARVVEIGQISTYDDPDGGWTMDIRPLHKNGLQFTGYNPLIFHEYAASAAVQLGEWVRTGKIIALETVVNGVENAPNALMGLFRGDNIGKMIVHVAD